MVSVHDDDLILEVFGLVWRIETIYEIMYNAGYEGMCTLYPLRISHVCQELDHSEL